MPRFATLLILLTAAMSRVSAQATSGSITGDRKSTRLNSSHSQISYAVFCLKKKTSEHEPKRRSISDASSFLSLHSIYLFLRLQHLDVCVRLKLCFHLLADV